MNKPEVIFEDEEIMVLNKPSGWIVNDSATVGEQPVIQSWIKSNFKFPIAGSKDQRNGIVHRLDKETSGCLVVAKTGDAFENLQGQFKERRVEKTYLALAHGKVFPAKDEINVPVGRLPWRRDRFGVLPGGRDSLTHYKLVTYYSKGSDDYSLLALKPKTGRTHQIRIHLKYLGYPIVSDEFYAGRRTAREDRKWCPRLFLHAKGISFFHPKTNKKVSFEADLHKDLQEALDSLEKTREKS